ncbi:dirigent protein 23 [Quercus suber]|uniref:Dirigent protein n=1 Tax=Quercus suber TaxID=58331 RepID=A0AAW0JSN7_QUESU
MYEQWDVVSTSTMLGADSGVASSSSSRPLKNPSAVEVAEASKTKKSPTLFGLVNIFDDPLTKGPEPTSKLVGRAQGVYGPAGQQEVGLPLARNLVSTVGQATPFISYFFARLGVFLEFSGGHRPQGGGEGRLL